MKIIQWVLAGLGGTTLVAVTFNVGAVEYNYNVGPNYADASGTACRATTEAREYNIQRGAGQIGPILGSERVVCPINRRGTSVYGRLGNTVNPETELTVNSVTVTLNDSSSTTSGSCFAYADALTTNSVVFGPVRYVCATQGGCTSTTTTYTGNNDVNLPFPAITNNRTVNFGYMCDLGRGARVLYASTSITPNSAN
jgi:hypothetical protein